MIEYDSRIMDYGDVDDMQRILYTNDPKRRGKTCAFLRLKKFDPPDQTCRLKNTDASRLDQVLHFPSCHILTDLIVMP